MEVELGDQCVTVNLFTEADAPISPNYYSFKIGLILRGPWLDACFVEYSMAHASVCVFVCVLHIVMTSICLSLARWGQCGQLDCSLGLFEGKDLVLGLRLELVYIKVRVVVGISFWWLQLLVEAGRCIMSVTVLSNTRACKLNGENDYLYHLFSFCHSSL